MHAPYTRSTDHRSPPHRAHRNREPQPCPLPAAATAAATTPAVPGHRLGVPRQGSWAVATLLAAPPCVRRGTRRRNMSRSYREPWPAWLPLPSPSPSPLPASPPPPSLFRSAPAAMPLSLRLSSACHSARGCSGGGGALGDLGRSGPISWRTCCTATCDPPKHAGQRCGRRGTEPRSGCSGDRYGG